VEYRSHFEEANLTFDADTGKRARFEQPRITGTPGVPEQSIVRVTHWKRLYGLLGWQDLTATRLRQGIENIRNYYEKRNLLDSRVTLTRLEYHPGTNTTQPIVNVQTGPRLILKTTGAKISERQLRAT
jgi:outer membrane protein assembly factor BamA